MPDALLCAGDGGRGIACVGVSQRPAISGGAVVPGEFWLQIEELWGIHGVPVISCGRVGIRGATGTRGGVSGGLVDMS